MIKITRIKKGLVNRFTDRDAIKCPLCNEICMINKVTEKEIHFLIECQEIKDKMRA